MARVTPWAKLYVTPVPWLSSALVQVDAYWTQTMVLDLEPRKARALYPTDLDHLVAYDATCKAQEALLMDIADRLISEVRALRDGQATPLAARDPALDPYTLALTSLGMLATDIIDGNAIELDMLTELQAIRAAVEGGTLDQAGLFEKLDTLILLLGAA